MGGSQLDLEEAARASARIADDPAFAALEASGAPIIAACGDPLNVVYLNDSARAIFGDDVVLLAQRLFRGDEPGAKRLAELVDSVRRGAALRLERLRFHFAGHAQTVTFLCRGLMGDGGAYVVVAALGVRPGPPLELQPAALAGFREVAEDPPSGATLALRASLAARHGVRAPRFLWKTDARGRFIDVTHVLADVVGESSADILGRTVEEAAQALALAPAFALAVASRRSWSGIDVAWPLDGADGRVPATLGALPMMDADRRFAGYQGYGVLHLDRALAAEAFAADEAPTAADAPAAGEELLPASAPLEAPRRAETMRVAERPADNIVLLRPPALSRPAQELAAREAALTSTERSAFDEIARALREGGPSAAQPQAADAEPRDEHSPAASGALKDVLDLLPVGVLIARGANTLFANRTLLDYLGYADRAAFDKDGGLARMFFGRAPGDVGARALAVQASDGESLDVDAHLQSVEWEGAPATLVTLRRHRPLPGGGPQESALTLARALEEKLARARAENALLAAAFDTARAPLAIVGADGRVEKFNAGFAAFLGVDARALSGRNLSSFFVPADARMLAQRLALSRADAEEALSLTARARGASVPVEAALRRLPLDGKFKICVSLRERAGFHRGDRELESARLAAETANAAKSDFLARVSHEIRTPLSAIIGFAEVMMEERLGPIGSPRYKEYLNDVHASGQHVLSLVNDLLDLSKIEAGKMELDFERVDANAIIAECASIMQTQANQARIVMRLALASNLPPIRADERSLRQILLNLLSNAVKFNEPGGQVIVSSALTEAGHVVIRVKDTGIGMSDDEIATALEPFKQIATARKVAGTGLGLPLTKALIEANHASFTIKSRKNEGTLIEIAFPPPQVLAAE